MVLRRSGQGEHWVLAYAWHPLLATNVAGSPHIDIVGALLLLLSVTALGAPLEGGRCGGVCAGCRREISSHRADTTLLAASAHPRWITGAAHFRIIVRSVSGAWADSVRFPQNLRAALPLQWPGFRGAGASGESSNSGWFRTARRVGHRRVASTQAQATSGHGGAMGMAYGRDSYVCAGSVSVVPAVDVAVPALGINSAAHGVDNQYFANLFRLAFAVTGTRVAGPCMDAGGGVWLCRRSCGDRMGWSVGQNPWC